MSKRERYQTLANILSLELGSLDVVTMTFGSSTPAHLYSSSIWELTPGHVRTKLDSTKQDTERRAGGHLVATRCSTNLLLHRRHTPAVSAGAEPLCEPLLEGANSLQGKTALALELLKDFRKVESNMTSSNINCDPRTFKGTLQLLFLLFSSSKMVLLCLPVQVLPPQSHLPPKLVTLQ